MIERRFYVSPNAFGKSIRLGKDESRHVSRVLRLGYGDEIRIFDGKGTECVYRINEVNASSVTIDFVCDVPPAAPESKLDFTLAVPLLKKANTELVLHKAVELGVTNFVPLISKRTVVKKERWNADRAERMIREASKQCGRATFTQLTEPIDFKDFVSAINGPGYLFYEEEGDSLPTALPTDRITVITGPEGGWERSEIDLAASHGIKILHFGGRILKAETAAIAATALIQNRFGDFN